MKAKGASGQLHIPAAEACNDQLELNIKHKYLYWHLWHTILVSNVNVHKLSTS